MPRSPRNDVVGGAVEYSGWKLNGVPEQSAGLVFMKPFAPEAIMNPDVPLVRSRSVSSSARPPPLSLASKMWMTTVSPGLMSSVWRFGVTVARSDSCGLGGPVGTPLCWINAKLTGSSQLPLQVERSGLHSRLSIVSAGHQ
jgi:hypothetical protein